MTCKKFAALGTLERLEVGGASLPMQRLRRLLDSWVGHCVRYPLDEVSNRALEVTTKQVNRVAIDAGNVVPVQPGQGISGQPGITLQVSDALFAFAQQPRQIDPDHSTSSGSCLK